MNQKKCGSCRYLSLTYEQQLARKEEFVRKSLGKGLVKRVMPAVGMEDPYHYRNKVTAVFARDRKGNPISGVYEGGTHHVLPVEECLIEDALADEIIGTIRGMLRSFKIWVYDEDTRRGILRYVLVRRGFATGQVMVVLVTASPVFPSRKNFVQALLKEHPQITTVVQNINGRTDSLILGDRQQVLYGKGYIEDVLCGRYIKGILEGRELDMEKELERLREDPTVQRFFDRENQVFPEADYWMCTDVDKFDFVLRVSRLEEDVFEVHRTDV